MTIRRRISRGTKTSARHADSLIEQLEPRKLLSASLTDYFPLAGGNTWTYQGTLVEDDFDPLPITVRTETTADHAVGGSTYTRFTTKVFDQATIDDADAYPIFDMRRFYRGQGGALVLGRERIGDFYADYERNFGSGLVMSPSSPSGSITYSFDYMVREHSDFFPNAQFPYEPGVLDGNVTITGPQAFLTPIGSFQAISVTRSDRFVELEDSSVEITETLYLTPGLGVIGMSWQRIEYVGDVALPQISFEALLTDSTLLDNLAIQDVSYNGAPILNGETPSGVKGTAFGAREISAEVIDRTFTVTNNGGMALELTRDVKGSFITIKGANPKQYSVVTQPRTSLQPGESTTFTIRFEPTALGVKFARFQIRTNASMEPMFQAIMRGTGTQFGSLEVQGRRGPAVAWESIAKDDASPILRDGTKFANAQADGEFTSERRFAVGNVGQGTLTFGNVRVSITGINASDFIVMSQPPSSLASGQGAYIRVVFNPTATGLRSALISIFTDDRANPTFSFNLSGVGT